MDLNHIYNLPVLYPELEAQFFFCVLKGLNLTISAFGTYASIHKIHFCLVMQGHLCILNMELYSVEKWSSVYMCSLLKAMN